MAEQPGHEVPHQVHPQGPAGAEIAEHPHQVRHAGEHHAAIGQRLAPVDRLAVHLEGDVPHHRQAEARGGDDDVGLQHVAGLQQNAVLGEALDLVGDHRGLARRDALEQVGVRHEGQALLPGAVAGGEVLHVEAFGQDRSDVLEDLVLHGVGIFPGHVGEHALVLEDLAPHDLVGPLLGDLQVAQGVGQLVGVAPGGEIGRRALQHGHVASLGRQGRDQGGRRRARADHHHLLVRIVQVFGPGLRMDDGALEVGHAGPLRRIALVVVVIALAHPQEAAGEGQGLAGGGLHRVHGPELLLAGPGGVDDLVAKPDMAGQIVLSDHLVHIVQDLSRCGDRRPTPGLEPVAEGIEVAVGADAGIAVGDPGAAIGVLGLKDREARARHLVRQVPGRSNPGNARAHHQHVEVLDAGCRLASLCRHIHAGHGKPLPLSFPAASVIPWRSVIPDGNQGM